MSLVKPLFMNTSEGFHEELSLTSGDALNVSNIVVPAAVDGGIGIDLGHNPIINVAFPVDPDDAVNKAYVDAIATGLDPHEACKLKTDHRLGSQGRLIGSGGAWTGALNTGDKFTVSVDGETPVLITLASAPVDRAAAITAINALYASGGGLSGTIAYAGATGQIDLRSATYGTGSSVAVTLADAVWGTEVGISNGTSTGAWFVASGSGVGKTLESPVNGGGYLNVIDGVTLTAADVTAGTRILVSMEGGGDTTGDSDNGIYEVTTLGGTSAKLKLTRTIDADTAASDELHKGTYAFITHGTAYTNTGWSEVLDLTTIDTDPVQWSQFSGAPGYTYDQGLILSGNSIKVDLDSSANAQGAGAPTAARKSGLEFDSDVAGGKLRVAVAANGGIQRNQTSPYGLEIKLNGTTLALSGAGAGISVLGVPSNFTINGVATNFANPGTGQVTAPNLDTLTAGSSSNADSLHTHAAAPATEAEKVEKDMGCAGGTVAIGDPVYISAANKVDEADTTDAKAKVIGVARTNPAANIVPVVVAGVCDGILSSATAGVPYYLQDGGGLGTGLPGAARRVIQCGIAWNSTDLFVRILDFGKKAA
jgi:hypothetical protein